MFNFNFTSDAYGWDTLTANKPDSLETPPALYPCPHRYTTAAAEVNMGNWSKNTPDTVLHAVIARPLWWLDCVRAMLAITGIAPWYSKRNNKPTK